MFLSKRPRRLRKNAAIRSLVKENQLLPTDFIAPLFITEGSDVVEGIPSMKGYYRRSLDQTKKEVLELYAMGIRAVLLFVKVAEELKDNKGTEALNPKGLMPRAISEIKTICPEMIVMTDVALDPYSSFGHDGIVENGKIINDPTVEVLAQMAHTHAQAGANFVAPSDMMDGRISSIRKTLENSGFTDTGIMSYGAKYASAYYGPFRDALDSKPGFGNKKTYQMNCTNAKEAIRETLLDIDEGADIVMIKPGMPYLDILSKVKDISTIPVSIYQVSGEYAMIKAAVEKGWINHDEAIFESLIAFKRAGADLIATYFAKEAIRLI